MSIVKINAISVPAGAGEELEKRFAARKNAVDSAPGFEGFELLRPVAGDDRYFVVTRWADEESFAAWRDSDPHTRKPGESGEEAVERNRASHGGAHTGGKKPVATGADLLEFEVVLESRP
ncbi:antibiotic biosynthesis monooxygenase family protein [Corynebacterium endometrii]|uniref:Heme-degrading monooxygenase HmoB n=1 Tax=Corynebacterium endometrii TaxID=2488819 RepID=A0A4P7QEA3_9CORY|nr:antibiotic biosynthesis monooxygenase [Corynebacterium endometrii]QCB27971.1 Heme-degrading monooxygenase HmoB [Corynebacterium endometrii]